MNDSKNHSNTRKPMDTKLKETYETDTKINKILIINIYCNESNITENMHNFTNQIHSPNVVVSDIKIQS